MLKLSDSLEQDIIACVKQWMKLLAEDRLDEACRLLDEPNSYGMVWTPEMIRETVTSTFSPDTVFYELHPEGLSSPTHTNSRSSVIGKCIFLTTAQRTILTTTYRSIMSGVI